MDDGWVYNTWCVAEGDPERDYSIDVYIIGQFIKRFDFEVRDMGLLTKLEND